MQIFFYPITFFQFGVRFEFCILTLPAHVIPSYRISPKDQVWILYSNSTCLFKKKLIFFFVIKETAREASIEYKTMHLDTKQRGTEKSSGLFSFSENRGMKASFGIICALFILLLIAHIFLSIAQCTKVNNNPMLV